MGKRSRTCTRLSSVCGERRLVKRRSSMGLRQPKISTEHTLGPVTSFKSCSIPKGSKKALTSQKSRRMRSSFGRLIKRETKELRLGLMVNNLASNRYCTKGMDSQFEEECILHGQIHP